jgi:disulfide bond formation protein DsbB
MHKIFFALVEVVCWFQIFLCPLLIFGVAGFIGYANLSGRIAYACLIGGIVAGAILGIYFAERIRRTIGCSTFLFRVSSSTDIDNTKDPS